MQNRKIPKTARVIPPQDDVWIQAFTNIEPSPQSPLLSPRGQNAPTPPLRPDLNRVINSVRFLLVILVHFKWHVVHFYISAAYMNESYSHSNPVWIRENTQFGGDLNPPYTPDSCYETAGGGVWDTTPSTNLPQRLKREPHHPRIQAMPERPLPIIQSH